MKRKWGVRAKLFACLGFVLSAAIASSVYSLYATYCLRRELRDEIDTDSARLDQSRQVANGLGAMRLATRGINGREAWEQQAAFPLDN